jgi:hypothetical protein
MCVLSKSQRSWFSGFGQCLGRALDAIAAAFFEYELGLKVLQTNHRENIPGELLHDHAFCCAAEAMQSYE